MCNGRWAVGYSLWLIHGWYIRIFLDHQPRSRTSCKVRMKCRTCDLRDSWYVQNSWGKSQKESTYNEILLFACKYILTFTVLLNELYLTVKTFSLFNFPNFERYLGKHYWQWWVECLYFTSRFLSVYRRTIRKSAIRGIIK